VCRVGETPFRPRNQENGVKEQSGNPRAVAKQWQHCLTQVKVHAMKQHDLVYVLTCAGYWGGQGSFVVCGNAGAEIKSR
jgi:hypothetical protein